MGSNDTCGEKSPHPANRCDVVLVDDASELRFLVRRAVERDGRLNVVAEGGSGHDAIELAKRHHPSLLLLDVSMPDMDGLTALPHVRTASPETKVVMFSGFEGLSLAGSALEMGAAAYLDKSTPLKELASRLFAVACGGNAPGSRTCSPA